MMVRVPEGRFELPAFGQSQESFWGKAEVEARGDALVLYSYGTEVARIDGSGKLVRVWPDYSATTLRHVSAFARYYGVRDTNLSKSEWQKMPVAE